MKEKESASKELNRLRSYSTIFSSNSFKKLLRNSDYSFIDNNIKEYDLNKLGSRFTTYYDYIRFTYNELRKQYRNEYLYKNTLINEWFLKKYGVKDTIAINEFRVGNSIADFVLFNGTSKAFEIKTELDSNQRLKGQLCDYTKIFKQSYIVTHESLVNKYSLENESIGIIALIEQARSLKIEEVRPAVENNFIDVDVLMKSIRTAEYKEIVKLYYKELPKMTSFNMFETCSELIRKIPNEELNQLFITQIKKRKSNMNEIGDYFKELRQIGLALNLNSASFNKLNKQLTVPIKI